MDAKSIPKRCRNAPSGGKGGEIHGTLAARRVIGGHGGKKGKTSENEARKVPVGVTLINIANDDGENKRNNDRPG